MNNTILEYVEIINPTKGIVDCNNDILLLSDPVNDIPPYIQSPYELIINKVNSIGGSGSTIFYPSTSAIVQYVNNIVNSKTINGTLNRIITGGTSNNIIIDISSNYIGQTSINTLGTITGGTWQGSPISNTYISGAITWNNKVSSVGGVLNRTITGGTALNPTIDIDSNYIGQNSIKLLGTITGGTWNGTAIGDTYIGSASIWNNKVTTISGVINRTVTGGTATNPTIDISASYIGQISITTLGTITGGTWQGTAINDTYISSSSTWNNKISSVGGVLNRTITGGTAINPTIDISNNYSGQTSIVTVGTIINGTWNGNQITDAYITSASNWNNKLNSSDFNIFSGTTLPSLYYNKAQDDSTFLKITVFGSYTGSTQTTLNNKVTAVTGGTGNIVIFSTNGTISDSGITPASLSGGTGSGTTVNISGTLNRIITGGTATNPIIDISPNYIGQNSINLLGTITGGTWNGTSISDTYINSSSIWNNKVSSVGGVLNRTITGGTTINPTIDIDSNYIGQVSIKLLGTITGGTWNGSAISDGYISSSSTWNNKVSSIGGTLNRIITGGTSTNPTIDISASYSGQTSIVTLGTIINGTWNGVAIADSYISSSTTWNNKLNSSDFNVFSGTTLPNLYYNKTQIDSSFVKTTTFSSYTGSTLTTLNNKVTTVVGGTGNIVIFGVGGAISDSGITPASISGGTGSGTTTIVSGTLNRIIVGGTSSNPIVDISSNYVGQSSITLVGTITGGTWNGSQITDTYITSANNWNNKLNSSDFNIFSGTTLPSIYYNSNQIDTNFLKLSVFIPYTGNTQTAINNKVTAVTGGTGNIVIFSANGAIADSGVTPASISGGSGSTVTTKIDYNKIIAYQIALSL